MKQLVAIPVLAIGLTACGTSSNISGTGVINMLPAEMQAVVAGACSLSISFEAAGALINMIVPGAETAALIAKSFCDSMLPPTGRVRLKGSVISGTFRGRKFFATVQ